MKTKFWWRCPKCGYKNKWRWDIFEIPIPGDPPITMQCDNCDQETKMKCRLVIY